MLVGGGISSQAGIKPNVKSEATSQNGSFEKKKKDFNHVTKRQYCVFISYSVGAS